MKRLLLDLNLLVDGILRAIVRATDALIKRSNRREDD
jgi:hypothetical protein